MYPYVPASPFTHLIESHPQRGAGLRVRDGEARVDSSENADRCFVLLTKPTARLEGHAD